MQKIAKRLLLTGAAGGLGSVLRERLLNYSEKLRSSDISPLKTPVLTNEEFIACDLADKAGVIALAQDCDAIIHFGGVSTEHSFETILAPNISGTYHIYEGARIHGVKRVIFASSNHVIGFHERGKILQTDCEKRPDGYYGLSKAYGEDLASFYFHRYGIETLSIRIGSSFPEPTNERMLSTWLSYDDLEQLIYQGLTTPNVGHTIVYGASNNKNSWWDNRGAAHLNYQPKDSADTFAASIASQQPPPADPGKDFQGGGFTEQGPFE